MLKRLVILFFICPAAVLAQGHGPVFGYATPTNSQGEYSFDAGLLTRTSAGGRSACARGIVTYGFTSFLQIAITTPALLNNTLLPPTRMTGGDDFEAKLGWRFHHHIKGVGTRFESTLFTGLVVPGPQSIRESSDQRAKRSRRNDRIHYWHCLSQSLFLGWRGFHFFRFTRGRQESKRLFIQSRLRLPAAFVAHRTKQMGLARSCGNDGRTIRRFPKRRASTSPAVNPIKFFSALPHSAFTNSSPSRAACSSPCITPSGRCCRKKIFGSR